uniref:RING-type domain-containing protein n=1 Tax=Vitis vinifera TaxID=29760 RepID=A5BML1_VITVI|nr:hypothetical protein VITISV_008414 [Vitis vinifera]
MLLSIFLALFLPCAGMSVVFVVYICLLWYSALGQQPELPAPVKPESEKGLSASDLDKLPKLAGKDLVVGAECAVCLDEIESDAPARLIPGCNHGFHLQCADTWLSKHSSLNLLISGDSEVEEDGRLLFPMLMHALHGSVSDDSLEMNLPPYSLMVSLPGVNINMYLCVP